MKRKIQVHKHIKIIRQFFLLTEWINEEQKELQNDITGDKKYIHICNETGVIPVSYFLRHLEEKEFTMKFHGLGPLGAKAISFPLKVTCHLLIK